MPRSQTCIGWLIAILLTGAALADGRPRQHSPSPPVSDSLYTALHPRLLFSRSDIPALRAKLHNGGGDDEAWASIQNTVDSIYPISSLGELMDQTYGMNVSLNAGLVSHVDEPPNDAATEWGRQFTLAVVNNFAPDDDPFLCPIRLRILCLGYDLCMDRATPAERDLVRTEIESYMDSLMLAFNFERWLHRPYTSNYTAMMGSSLGLAAICLADEIAPDRVVSALARADTFVAVWKRTQLDTDGSYREGVQYGTWSMRHLPAYFEARRRFDGVDYAQDPALRAMEQWIAYELLPETGGAVNNLNDTAYLNWPLSRHNTYLEWAMSRWSSPLSAWIWERALGPTGHDWGISEDRASTALWWQPVTPESPAGRLPRSVLYSGRGLYYHRTGWPQGDASDDVVFSFYSGKFQGGHSQEDQNSFTLYAFGARLAADNGYDVVNAASAAHNMVFIDGNGQHHSGSSVGTDGRIAGHVLADYGDYVFGDATAAYTTYSEFNRPGYPFPDDDWSYGYSGANPVLRAHRRWIVVHDGTTPPYFIVQDDIQKDAFTRTYDWRMHTDAANDVDIQGDQMIVTAPRGSLVLDILSPARSAIAPRVEPYSNPSSDPDTQVLVLSQAADAGQFALLLLPVANGATPPVVTRLVSEWGGAEALEWPGGATDVVVSNPGQDTVWAELQPVSGTQVPGLGTDARLGQMRFRGDKLDRYIMVDAAFLGDGDHTYVKVENGPLTIVFDGARVDIDREDAQFTLWGPDVSEIRFRGKKLNFDRKGDFVSRNAHTSARPPSALGVRVFPNPFRGEATIIVESAQLSDADVTVYDVAGRVVRHVYDGPAARGNTFTRWDGRGEHGAAAASGVYFVKVQTAGESCVAKMVLVR